MRILSSCLVAVALLAGSQVASAQTQSQEPPARGCATCSSIFLWAEGGWASYDLEYGAPCEPEDENCARCPYDDGCWNGEFTYTAIGLTDPCLDDCPSLGLAVEALNTALENKDFESVLALIDDPKQKVSWNVMDDFVQVEGCSQNEAQSIVLSSSDAASLRLYATAARKKEINALSH